MKHISRWIAVSLALVLITTANAASPKHHSPAPHIEVSGQGVIQATPDIAIVELTFSMRDKEASRAKQQVDEQVQQFLALSEQLNIDARDIHAARLNIHPEFDHNNNRQLIGYRVSREVQVKIDDLLKYPQLLEGAVTIGATHTGQLQLDFSNRKALENEALMAAFEDARQQASLLAQAADGTLGNALWIHTSGTEYPTPVRLKMMAEMSADASYPTGEMALTRQVQVRFYLQVNH